MSFRRVLALVALLLGAACHSRPTASAERPNILLVTIDTFRADRLNPAVTPNLDRLARRSVMFTAARSAVPLTLPSHATILTGLLPGAHGVRENGLDRLADRHQTIATLLQQAGYQTAAFVGAFVLDRRFGLARGFDLYDDHIARDPAAPDRLEAERPASAVIDAALAWLERTGNPAEAGSTQMSAPQRPAPSAQRPFLAWIHLYDPHAPYSPPAEYATRARSAYDGEVMYADAQLARVWDWLDGSGVARNTAIVVAGDHGEGLGEHGESSHGMLLYDSTLRVPLLVSAPGIRAERRDDAVSLVDVAPTILHLAGIHQPTEMQAHTLIERRESTAPSSAAARPLFSETEYPRVAGWSPLQSLTDGRWKAIRRRHRSPHRSSRAPASR